MTGPEHYRVAEAHAKRADKDWATGNVKEMQTELQFAEVHATLALVAAAREIGDQLDTLPRHPVDLPIGGAS